MARGKITKKNTSGILSSLLKKVMDFIIGNASKRINPCMPLYGSKALKETFLRLGDGRGTPQNYQNLPTTVVTSNYIKYSR